MHILTYTHSAHLLAVLVDISVESAHTDTHTHTKNNTNTHTDATGTDNTRVENVVYKGVKHGKLPPTQTHTQGHTQGNNRQTMHLLAVEEIASIGGVILSGLGKLKHMGAISGGCMCVYMCVHGV